MSTHTKLIGSFSRPEDYANTVLEIRNYYGPYIAQDRIMVFAVMSPDHYEIVEHLMTFNLLSFDRIIFRKGDVVLNKRGKALFTVNGMNALQRDLGLPKGSSVDWEPYQGSLVTEQGVFPHIQKLKFISYG